MELFPDFLLYGALRNLLDDVAEIWQTGGALNGAAAFDRYRITTEIVIAAVRTLTRFGYAELEIVL